jgi:hypothetical protein
MKAACRKGLHFGRAAGLPPPGLARKVRSRQEFDQNHVAAERCTRTRDNSNRSLFLRAEGQAILAVKSAFRPCPFRAFRPAKGHENRPESRIFDSRDLAEFFISTACPLYGQVL